MLSDPTPANIAAFERGKRALEAATAFPDKKDSDSTFPTLAAACDYLKRHGRKCKKSKLDKDTKLGLIARSSDGSYTQLALEKYGEAHCMPLSGVNAEEAEDYWLKRKRRADAIEAEQKAKQRELQVAQLERRLADVDTLWSAWAASAIILKSAFENWAHEVAERLVELVGGNDAKIPDAVILMVEEAEIFFDAYAEKRQFHAVLAGKDDFEWELEG